MRFALLYYLTSCKGSRANDKMLFYTTKKTPLINTYTYQGIHKCVYFFWSVFVDISHALITLNTCWLSLYSLRILSSYASAISSLALRTFRHPLIVHFFHLLFVSYMRTIISRERLYILIMKL